MRLQMRLRSLASPGRSMTWACVLPGQRWRRMRDSNSRGVAPNTLSNNAPQRSCQAGAVRDLGGPWPLGLGGRSRIPANETANETAAEVRGMTQASPLAGEILLYLTRAARPAACLFCVMTSTALVGRSAELRRLAG